MATGVPVPLSSTAVKDYCYIFFFCDFIARNKPIEPFVFYERSL